MVFIGLTKVNESQWQPTQTHADPQQPRRPKLGFCCFFFLFCLIYIDEIYNILEFIGPVQANEGQR